MLKRTPLIDRWTLLFDLKLNAKDTLTGKPAFRSDGQLREVGHISLNKKQ